MAYLPMISGGGAMTETVLWTNLNPSNNFDAQTITVDDDFANYQFIKIEYYKSTSSQYWQYYSSTCFDIDEFLDCQNNSQHPKVAVFGTRATATAPYPVMVRYAYVTDTNKLYIAAGRQDGGNSNSIIIPKRIIGIK